MRDEIKDVQNAQEESQQIDEQKKKKKEGRILQIQTKLLPLQDQRKRKNDLE